MTTRVPARGQVKCPFCGGGFVWFEVNTKYGQIVWRGNPCCHFTTAIEQRSGEVCPHVDFVEFERESPREITPLTAR